MKILVVFLFASYVVCRGSESEGWSFRESNFNPSNWFRNRGAMNSRQENLVHTGELVPGQRMHQNPDMNHNGVQEERQPLDTNGAITEGQAHQTGSMGPNGHVDKQGPQAGSMSTGRSNGNADENHGTQNSQRSGSGQVNNHENGNQGKPSQEKSIQEQQLDELRSIKHEIGKPRPLTGLEKFANLANIGITFLFVPGATLSIYGSVEQKKESAQMDYYQKQALDLQKQFQNNQTRLAEEANEVQLNLTKQFLAGATGGSGTGSDGTYVPSNSPVPDSSNNGVPVQANGVPDTYNNGNVDPFTPTQTSGSSQTTPTSQTSKIIF